MAVLAVGVLVASCRPPEYGEEETDGAWHFQPNAYAEHFAVGRKGDSTLLVVLGHGGAGDTVGRYVVGGMTGFDRIALGSTTHVPFVSTLGLADRVVGCAHSNTVREPLMAARIAGGEVSEIAAGDGIDREKLLALRPSVLFAYPFGSGQGSTFARSSFPVVQVSEYLEQHPLGRAEWLRFFGLLLGCERQADSTFKAISARYQALRLDTTTADRPTVLFGSVWDGQWWVPPGNSYMARLISDAGGHYVFSDRTGTGNIAVDMETMLRIGASAEHWGMVTGLHGPVSEDVFTGSDHRLRHFKAVQDHHLFASSSEMDFFGQAMVEPDRLLFDLRSILYRSSGVSFPALDQRWTYFAPIIDQAEP